MSIAVYTCVVNDYDFLLPPAMSDPTLEFFCFTDAPKKRIHGWSMLPLHCDAHNGSYSMVNRYHKFFPHELFPTFDWSIYIDGNVRIIGPVSELVSRTEQAGKLMACPRHSQRSTIPEEIVACDVRKKFQKDEREIAEEQYAYYRSCGMPVSVPLMENYLIIRKHSEEKIQEAMALWWDELNRWSNRDQLSLPYVLWKTELAFLPLHENKSEENSYFYRYIHNKGKLITLKKKLKLRRNEIRYKYIYFLTYIPLKILIKLLNKIFIIYYKYNNKN